MTHDACGMFFRRVGTHHSDKIMMIHVSAAAFLVHLGLDAVPEASSGWVGADLQSVISDAR
jgi:hypothetical protein